MRWSLVSYICGVLTMIIGSLMIFPVLMAFYDAQWNDMRIFMYISISLILLGWSVSVLSKRQWDFPSTREMFVTTSSVWVLVSFLAALPFYFVTNALSFTDSMFESVSGLSTTGATILNHISQYPRSLLLWRAMTQWIGGVGIVILAITLLPILRIGGMQLFSTENSDKSDKDAPFVSTKMRSILMTYFILSVACFAALYFAGMGIFDALAHMMTCVSSGGFSTYDNSIAHFNSPLIEWILIFFMILAGLPLVFIHAGFHAQWRRMKNDEQTWSFLKFLLICVLIISVGMFLLMPRFSNFEETLRLFTFHMVSIVTTTGYVVEDYTNWGSFFVAFFLFLTIVGACTGSTSGGIKIFRFNILWGALKRHLSLMITPHAVIVPHYNHKPVTDEIILGVTSFLTVFGLTAVLSSIGLSLTGLDFQTSLSGALTAISNVGPGIGSMIGPDNSMALLPTAAKWIMLVTMVLGRLEFMTVVVLFLPVFWKRR